MADSPASHDARRAQAQTLAKEIYATQRRRLLAIGKRNCTTIEDAEEALQDTFILFINHFNPESGAPPLAWLTLTLKRRCWACYRHQQLLQRQEPLAPTTNSGRSHQEELMDPSRLPDELAAAAANVTDARERIANLKADERRALSLLAIGYSYREISKITGWTYTKVNRCISEGRTSLRADETKKQSRGAKTKS